MLRLSPRGFSRAALLFCACALPGLAPLAQAAPAAPVTHIVWTNTDGRLSLWNYTDNGAYTQTTYGPYAGWTVKAIADGPDGRQRVLWTNKNGSMSLWSLDNATGQFTQNSFGPFAGWSALDLSVAPGMIDHTKLASDGASLSQVSGGLLSNPDGFHTIVAHDMHVHGTVIALMGNGGGIGNNNGAARALVDGGQGGLIINYANDYGKVLVQSDCIVDGILALGNGTIVSANDININKNTTVHGTLTSNSLQLTGGSDLAEPYTIAAAADTQPLPGMVVAIDPNQTGRMRVCTHAYDTTVGGIISGAGGVQPGITLRQKGTVADGTQPIACTGRVWCWCDADAGGAISPGDLLTTADTPGHAMRVRDYSKAQGAVLGKAMSSLKTGKGLVLVLVTLQ